MSLFSHQARENIANTVAPARALFWEPRVGKTRTIVEQIRAVALPRVLVVAPIMALRMTWADELRALHGVTVVDLSRGTILDRTKKLAALKADKKAGPTIVLVNYEALKPLELPLIKWAPAGIVVDESHLIKSSSAQRTRTLIKLGARATWKRLLTGTPTPKSYVDIYAQYRFLDPTIFGTSLARFMGEYCYTHKHWKSKVTGYKNLPEFETKMFSIASRVTRAECFDLPHVQEIERTVTLPAQARKAYDQMVKEQVLDMAGLPKVDATHKLARLVKLQKLTAGFVSEGDTLVWVHREKIEAVLSELAEPMEAGQRVVVSYYFEHEGAELEQRIRATYGPGGASVERLSGKTPQRDRERITAPFGLSQRASDNIARVLIVQEAVGGLGISLAAADHMIFTSCSMDGASHSQMRDRVWSPSKKITYTYIRVPSSVDGFIRKVLATKDTAQRLLLDVGFADAAYSPDELLAA